MHLLWESLELSDSPRENVELTGTRKEGGLGSAPLPFSCTLLLMADLRWLGLSKLGFPVSGLCVWEMTYPIWAPEKDQWEDLPWWVHEFSKSLSPEETWFFGLRSSLLGMATVNQCLFPRLPLK